MSLKTNAELLDSKCQACEGGVPKLSTADSQRLLGEVSGWTLTRDGDWIEKRWKVKNFVAGLGFLSRVGEVAEAEGHHPDLHLEGYRHVRIEISTHAVGGLTENDFILAAKIDRVAPTA